MWTAGPESSPPSFLAAKPSVQAGGSWRIPPLPGWNGSKSKHRLPAGKDSKGAVPRTSRPRPLAESALSFAHSQGSRPVGRLKPRAWGREQRQRVAEPRGGRWCRRQPLPTHPLPQWQARGTPELYALMSCLPDKPSYLPGRLLEVILNLPFIRDQRQELKAGVWGFQKNL